MHYLDLIATHWDRTIFLEINHGLKNPFLDIYFSKTTNLGLGGVQACIVLLIAITMGAIKREIHLAAFWKSLWLTIYHRREWVSPLLVCFIIGGLAADTIKEFVSRQRPWWFYHNQHMAGKFLNVIVYRVPGLPVLKVYGFPSGHTTTSFAMATVATLLFSRSNKALVALLWFAALSIALSRIYLAYHWPLDVLGGSILGVVSAFISMKICRNYSLKRNANP